MFNKTSFRFMMGFVGMLLLGLVAVLAAIHFGY